MYQYHIPQNAMVILYHCRLSRRNYQYTIYRSTVSTHLHFYRCCCWQFWWFLGLHPRGGCCLESETHGAICCWWLAASWVLPTRAACYHCSPRGDLIAWWRSCAGNLAALFGMARWGLLFACPVSGS